MKVRTTILWVVALASLLLVNYSIFQKEQLIRTGEPLYVELGPRDPRSLIQGDYMALRYQLVERLAVDTLPARGKLVIKRSNAGIASFVRLEDGTTPLAADERRLNYYKAGGDINVGAPSFFFEEGQAEAYSTARYGELRATPDGESVLVGLRGPKLEQLGKPAR